jgi:hypothetical protein
LRNDVSEPIEQIEKFLFAQRIFVFLFNPRNFTSQTPVHVFGRLFVNIAVTVLQGVFADPNFGRQFIPLKIFQRFVVRLVERIGFLIHHRNVL